jgi:hypothetical protein
MVEVGFERLAEAQEEILWLSEAAFVPVVWATQVLEGLNQTGVPSRAAHGAAPAEEAFHAAALAHLGHLVRLRDRWRMIDQEMHFGARRPQRTFVLAFAAALLFERFRAGARIFRILRGHARRLTLPWSSAGRRQVSSSQATDANSGVVMSCIANGAYARNTTPAVSHARCAGTADGR